MRLCTPPLKVVSFVPVEGTLPVIMAAFTVLLALAVPIVFALVLSLNADERMVMASHIRAAGTQVPLLVVESGNRQVGAVRGYIVIALDI